MGCGSEFAPFDGDDGISRQTIPDHLCDLVIGANRATQPPKFPPARATSLSRTRTDDRERAALSNLAAYDHAAPVRIGDAFDDRQAESNAAAIRRRLPEALEEVPPILDRDSRTVVSDAECNRLSPE